MSTLKDLRQAISKEIDLIVNNSTESTIPLVDIFDLLKRNINISKVDRGYRGQWYWNDWVDRKLKHIIGSAKYSSIYKVIQPGGRYGMRFVRKI